jgi:hypothetical protein
MPVGEGSSFAHPASKIAEANTHEVKKFIVFIIQFLLFATGEFSQLIGDNLSSYILYYKDGFFYHGRCYI